MVHNGYLNHISFLGWPKRLHIKQWEQGILSKSHRGYKFILTDVHAVNPRGLFLKKKVSVDCLLQTPTWSQALSHLPETNNLRITMNSVLVKKVQVCSEQSFILRQGLHTLSTVVDSC